MPIVRRYGNKVQSVTPNFDSRAMTEIGFVRGGEVSLSAEEFEKTFDRLFGRELRAKAEGEVQGDVEDAVLASLAEQLEALAAEAGDGSLLVIENQQGVDQPKTRGRQTTIVVDGENRLVFEYTVEPPLRIGVFGPV
ncbi:MAG: hypothetical protein ACREL7_04490 [Longimicrobiales bacterium]